MSKKSKKALSIALFSLIFFSVFSIGNIPRSLQASTTLRVQARNSYTADMSNTIGVVYKLFNDGPDAVDLSAVKIRYYYTIDGIRNQNFWCDWSTMGQENVTGTFSPLTSATPDADTCLEIGFTGDAGALTPGNWIEFHTRISKDDWTNYDQTDDYSFGTATLADSPQTPICLNGILVYGTEPDTPPVITHSAVSSAEANVAIPMTATITDTDAVTAKVYYGDRANGSGFTDYVTMDHSSGSSFTADIPGADAGDLYYYIQAADSKSNIAVYPSDISACNRITVSPSYIHDIKQPFYAGQVRTIDGMVTYAKDCLCYVQEPGANEDGDLNTSEGMAVVFSSGSLGWNPGDSVTVKGTITLEGSRLILVPDGSSDWTVNSNGNLLPGPFETSIPLIGSSCEGMRILLRNVIIGPVDIAGNTPLYDSDGNTIRIDQVPALAGITAGDRIDVTAIAVGKSPYELLVASASDVTRLAGDTTSPAISANSPNGAGVPISASSIDLAFDEIVKAVSGKVVRISDDTKTYTADVGAVLGSNWFGNAVAIPLSSLKDSSDHSLSLEYGAEYTVSVPAGAFADIAGLHTPATSWVFNVEPAPLAPSAMPLNLRVKKGASGTILVSLGQGAGAASSASISSLSANILTSPATLTSNGEITLRGLHTGTAEILITFDDPTHRVITVRVTVSSDDSGSSVDSYSISSQAEEGGSIRLASTNVARNSNTSFEVTPDPGYQISDVWVNGASVGPVTFYEVKNITSNTMIKAFFNQTTAVWSNPFIDVHEKDWFYPAVAYTTQNGLFHGTGPHCFSAEQDMTRAMFVSVLANMEQADIRPSTTRFIDVAPDAWYAGSVAWAEHKGIVSGLGQNRFAPERAITRQEIIALLYNYAKLSGLDISNPEGMTMDAYGDCSQISEWAIPAMRWAIHEGLICEKNNDLLDPQAFATRGEAAALVQRFDQRCQLSGNQ